MNTVNKLGDIALRVSSLESWLRCDNMSKEANLLDDIYCDIVEVMKEIKGECNDC